MQKGTRKTAATREMLRNTILEIKEKLRGNMFHELTSISVNGKLIQGCIEQNPKKVLMPIYLPPGFYIVHHDVAVPNWLTSPAIEKLEKNMYWKASGISKCDDFSEVIPFSLASLQLRGYIFSLKCDAAIGILEIYPRKQPNSTPKPKTVKKDQSNKAELKMKKALTLSNNDNFIQQQPQATKQSKQQQSKQQQNNNNNKQQQRAKQQQKQQHQLSIQPIKVENENDIDQCSLTSCTKRQREHTNDSGWVSFLEPQRSDRKRVKIGKDMKENQSSICKSHDASTTTTTATTLVATSINTNGNANGNGNSIRAFDDEDLSSFLCDIDTFAPSLPGIPHIFDGINYGTTIGAQQQQQLHHQQQLQQQIQPLQTNFL